MPTLVDVKFPSSTAYFSSSSKDILQTLFFISVFFLLFFFWLKTSLKNLTYVSRKCTLIIVQFLVCILTVVAYTSFMVFSSRLSFTVSMFIAHATELVYRSTSMYQWPCPFRTSDYSFTILVFIMILAAVIGLRLDSDIVFFAILNWEKWNFSPSATFAI